MNDRGQPKGGFRFLFTHCWLLLSHFAADYADCADPFFSKIILKVVSGRDRPVINIYTLTGP